MLLLILLALPKIGFEFVFHNVDRDKLRHFRQVKWLHFRLETWTRQHPIYKKMWIFFIQKIVLMWSSCSLLYKMDKMSPEGKNDSCFRVQVDQLYKLWIPGMWRLDQSLHWTLPVLGFQCPRTHNRSLFLQPIEFCWFYVNKTNTVHILRV